PGRRAEPPRPPDRGDELAAERGERAVRARSDLEPLNRRVSVPAGEVLLAPGQGAPDGAPGLPGELGSDEGVVAGFVLGSEPTAHELADHADAVARQAERLGDLVAHAPDVLRRDVDHERLALPGADGLVRL